MDFDTLIAALRSNAESTSVDAEGTWGMVYLANARPDHVSPHSFAGLLSTLTRLGYYRQCDGYFGEVLMTARLVEPVQTGV